MGINLGEGTHLVGNFTGLISVCVKQVLPPRLFRGGWECGCGGGCGGGGGISRVGKGQGWCLLHEETSGFAPFCVI